MTRLTMVKIKDLKNRERFSFFEDGNGDYFQKLQLADDATIILYKSRNSNIINIYDSNSDKLVYVQRKVISLEKFRYIFAEDENGKIDTDVLERTEVSVVGSSTDDKYVVIGHLNTFAVPCLIAEYWAKEIRKALNS